MNIARLSNVQGWWFCFALPVKTCSRGFVSLILTFLVDQRHVLDNLRSEFPILNANRGMKPKILSCD